MLKSKNEHKACLLVKNLTHENNKLLITCIYVYIICFLLFWRCTDINHKATEIAQQTGRENGINIQPVTTDLVGHLLYIN